MTTIAGPHECGQVWPLVANISILFTELPLLDRISAAEEAGFDAIEAWWPFRTASADREVEEFLDHVDGSGLQLTGLNFFAGDMTAGERGIISLPKRRAEFTQNLAAIVRIATRTGATVFNALYGQRQPGTDPAEQDRIGFDNLVVATNELATVGGTVLLEPLSRGLNGDYPLQTAEQAIRLSRRVRSATGTDNIGLLLDTFHLANNGEDLLSVIETYTSEIMHVQLADAPGRGAPGTGSVDFDAILNALADVGYCGRIACEYAPGVPTLGTLDWISKTDHVRLGSSRES